jgi:hypothetical protein
MPVIKVEELPFSNIAHEFVGAGVPHGFKNTGDGVLKQVDIHVSPSFSTEWLD